MGITATLFDVASAALWRARIVVLRLDIAVAFALSDTRAAALRASADAIRDALGADTVCIWGSPGATGLVMLDTESTHESRAERKRRVRQVSPLADVLRLPPGAGMVHYESRVLVSGVAVEGAVVIGLREQPPGDLAAVIDLVAEMLGSRLTRYGSAPE